MWICRKQICQGEDDAIPSAEQLLAEVLSGLGDRAEAVEMRVRFLDKTWVVIEGVSIVRDRIAVRSQGSQSTSTMVCGIILHFLAVLFCSGTEH